MKRSDFFFKTWRDQHGALAKGASIAILGGGISGLHLAHAFAERRFSVTVFESSRVGGIRIPLMHACHTLKVRSPLWETAAEYGRTWYRSASQNDSGITEKKDAFGDYFNIRARRYLQRLKRSLTERGVIFADQELSTEKRPGFALHCIATGAAAQGLIAGQIISGWESYFSRQDAPNLQAISGLDGSKITNYIDAPPRAGFIHRNAETNASAVTLGKKIHTKGRHALFHGIRLTTRDRLPAVGFLPPAAINTYAGFFSEYSEKSYAEISLRNQSPFLFCAMGYHAMTFAPYLSQAVAAQFAGEDGHNENLVCTLTPARFLPRK